MHRVNHASPFASPSRVASAPGSWLARIAPYASPFRRMREKGPLPGNICAKCMLLEIKMARSSPYASISRRNRAIRDAWRANLAIKAPLSRRGPRNHTWREDVANAARPFAAPRRGSRARELALRPAVRALPACRMHESLPVPPPRRYLRPGSATHRCHSHVRAAPHRCRYSRGRIHRRCPSRRARRAHHATRVVHCGRGWTADRALPAARIALTGPRSRSGLHHASRTLGVHRNHPHRPSQSGVGRRSGTPPPLRCPCPRTLPRTHRASCWPTRAPLPCRADSAAVPAIPAKWCGDTIAHTRKLRF